MLSSDQIKILRFAKESPVLFLEISDKFHLSESELNEMITVEFSEYIDIKYNHNLQQTTFHTNSFGRTLLKNSFSDSFRWWLPTVISILALVKSFLPEFLSLLQWLASQSK